MKGETTGRRNANTAVSAADSVLLSTTQIELDVSDVKVPVKAINFTDNGGKAWSVLRRLQGAGLGAFAESSSDYASLCMAARI